MTRALVCKLDFVDDFMTCHLESRSHSPMQWLLRIASERLQRGETMYLAFGLAPVVFEDSSIGHGRVESPESMEIGRYPFTEKGACIQAVICDGQGVHDE